MLCVCEEQGYPARRPVLTCSRQSLGGACKRAGLPERLRYCSRCLLNGWSNSIHHIRGRQKRFCAAPRTRPPLHPPISNTHTHTHARTRTETYTHAHAVPPLVRSPPFQGPRHVMLPSADSNYACWDWLNKNRHRSQSIYQTQCVQLQHNSSTVQRR